MPRGTVIPYTKHHASDRESASHSADVTLINVSSEDDNDDLIITPKAPLAITVLSPSPPAFLLRGKSRKLGRR